MSTLRYCAPLFLGLLVLQGCVTTEPGQRSTQALSSVSGDVYLSGVDQTLSSGDVILSGGSDSVLNNGDRTLGGSDLVLSGGDGVLSRGNVLLNSAGDKPYGGVDQHLNPHASIAHPTGDIVPKRGLSAPEMAALTVAVSSLSDDPNALSIVDAAVDDTGQSVRGMCARINDSRLDDDHNRFNVVFGVLEPASTRPFDVSIIDSGQRASVACSRLGYLS